MTTLDHDIERRIDTALEHRRQLRPAVDGLVAALGELRAQYTALTERVAAVPWEALDTSRAPREVREFLRDAAAHSGGTTAPAVQLDRTIAQVRRVRQRVRREYLVIGAIGRTRQGKTTLLRSITGLDRDVLPAEQAEPTTATVSRIFHRSGPPEVQVLLHDWVQFRDFYLRPLHQHAGVDPQRLPRTPEEFRDFPYKDPARQRLDDSDLKYEQFLRKLRTAQQTLDDYLPLLRGASTIAVDLAQLRPYLAYPRQDHPEDRAYFHAVREVRIWTDFLDGNARIGIVDLPGPGEAGLIDRRLVQGLTNDVDLLMLVKKPDGQFNNAAFQAEDWTPSVQAEEAAAGVRLRHFLVGVANFAFGDTPSDTERDAYQRAVANMRAELSQKWGAQCYEVDALRPQRVHDHLLIPLLTHLGEHIAEMDRQALDKAEEHVRELRADIDAYAARVLTAARACLAALPSEKRTLAVRADQLRLAVGTELTKLSRQYADDPESARHEPNSLGVSLRQAGDAVRALVAGGLGAGSEQRWQQLHHDKFDQEPLRTIEEAFVDARAMVTGAYRAVDVSVAEIARTLRSDIADRLRPLLGAELVPEGGEALRVLEHAARDVAPTLADGLHEIDNIDIAYGSVLLRVGGPIIQGIDAQNSLSPHDTPFAMAGHRNGSAHPDIGRVSLPGAVDLAGLYTWLTESALDAVARLDAAMAAESAVMRSVLAAATILLRDKIVFSPLVTREYEDLCEPYKGRIWPGDFDDRVASSAVALDRAVEAARAVTRATAAVLTRL
ncbi:hypothetical protein [Nocardia sp. alder85J]|uniref:hypothetical protein n=1 Tax=Nocardia sp. alder85J TaxID=2862949 RepID=UPI001CD7556D|nr:hypothetical protein [Nocardia sp. alder85J]MCX4094629.1 hypothetical protein [Nocardia sp. alder85J]